MTVQTLGVGPLRAAPGTKVTGFLEVPGTPIAMPVTLVHGTAPGPVLSVTAGVHGGEYPGIEAAIRTAAALDPAGIRGSVIIVHVVDVPAFHGRNIYVCPLDGKNPNRVFPGNPAGTASERLAHTVFTEVIARADFYVDLHGGDLNEALVPFTILLESGDPAVDGRALGLARVYGIKYVVRGRVAGGTYAAAAKHGIPAILTEAGGQGLLDEQAVHVHLQGLRNVLTHIGITPGDPDPVEPITLLSGFHWVTSEDLGLCYLGVAPGARVTQGQPVGEVRDYFGRRLRTVLAPASGIVLFTVTTPATSPGDPVFAVGTPG
ncbi:MAG TPA: M14 family metallopeptidase [bacterium]|nr:M14 family metallopeptidase [bacterium]